MVLYSDFCKFIIIIQFFITNHKCKYSCGRWWNLTSAAHNVYTCVSYIVLNRIITCMLQLVKYYYKTLFAANLNQKKIQSLLSTCVPGSSRESVGLMRCELRSSDARALAIHLHLGHPTLDCDSLPQMGLCQNRFNCSWFRRGFPWAGGKLGTSRLCHQEGTPIAGGAPPPPSWLWCESENNQALAFKTEFDWYFKLRLTDI